MKGMCRSFIVLAFWLVAASMLADDSLPIVEVKADRTMIYPQRMDLTGEESLMDVLQMMPDLMIGGYEELISGYNLRIDNVPMNGDVRLILSQMKAKDIAKIQVCDNTGVAKGTIGMGRVLDINMSVQDTVKGFVEGQGSFGKTMEGNGTVNVLYGSRKTDLYANATYRYQEGHKEYLTFHMTNRFDDRNKLLTYVTQQYLGRPDDTSQKIMGRARYFHTFNAEGTELLVLGGYQYDYNSLLSNQLPIYVVELNTPLGIKELTMMAGAEGDFLMTRQRDTDRSWDVFNNDLYLQLAYSLPHWRFMAGNRVMFYNYKLMESDTVQTYFDIRNNTSASVIYTPNSRHQIQLGYYRKFTNPAYSTLFMDINSHYDEEWTRIKGLLDEKMINQVKLSYAYSRQRLTVQTEASWYNIEEEGVNYAELGAAAYWRTQWVTLTGGTNVQIAKDNVFASLRLAPTAHLPRDWQIGLQVVYYTPKSPMRELYGTPVYGCLSVNKLIKKRWNVGIDWHDMFDSFCSTAKVNRHAIVVKLQFRY